MTIDELITLLSEVRVDLSLLKRSLPQNEIRDELKWMIKRIDLIGCELTQNMPKMFD